MMSVKADLAICSSAIGAGVWIVQECGFHVKQLRILISALAGLVRVFVNQVTIRLVDYEVVTKSSVLHILSLLYYHHMLIYKEAT